MYMVQLRRAKLPGYSYSTRSRKKGVRARGELAFVSRGMEIDRRGDKALRGLVHCRGILLMRPARDRLMR